MRFPLPGALLAGLLLLPAAAGGLAAQQARPDFSGTWVLQVERSDFGPVPAPASRTDVIEHREPALTIRRTQATPSGEATSTLVFVVDGKPHPNRVGDNELTSTLSWEGDALIIRSVLATGQGEATIEDRMVLSADGRILTQTRTIALGGQQLGQTLVLARQ